MQFAFFQVPAVAGEQQAQELNRFVATHKVSHCEKHFVEDGAQSYWALCVTYVSGEAALPKTNRNAKIDYKEVLNDTDFGHYAALRDWRKSVAQADAVPVYNVFTNEQLAQMVLQKITTASQLKSLEGVGEARVTRYFERLKPLLLARWGQQ